MRGYDAVHCASAEQLDDDEVVAAAADQRLLTAWLGLGMGTYDTNQRATPR
ncbi:twitching motility protein PilT [Mycobacterium tuberculosis]|uniref:twitching motility protein PilT n=1 Tax=Mycobacterium tuberculosis TaxID=1773 RepID=UPI0005E9C4AC|nr:twitching motility protein PilT [Mycobacterium tuberculosis]CFD45369.1 PilT protein domain protein [Mycobacterium tuberculosis]